MNGLKYFLENYFDVNENFDCLDHLIQEFKRIESNLCKTLFIKELNDFIQTKNYFTALRIIKKYGHRIFNAEETEQFINFLYDRLLDMHTNIKQEDFEKKYKSVLCPVCTPDPKAVEIFGLIEKAIVINKDFQIYICRPCKLVWLTKDIRSDNAQDYKKFMRTLGLKESWKELTDIVHLLDIY